MTNYQNGKVYKIDCINGEEGDMYVGSTAKQYLSQRMTFHRDLYKCWKEGKTNYLTSYYLFDKYGLENCSIILLETCPCNSRDELRGREGFHIRSLVCVNKKIEGRTRAEHYQDNIEEMKDKSNNYYANNKERVLVRRKGYRESHKEVLKEKVICECGSTCSRGSMYLHKKSIIHKNYENSLIDT